jgi:hypothetical protein
MGGEIRRLEVGVGKASHDNEQQSAVGECCMLGVCCNI